MNKVLLALVTGFVAGVLLAPDKGSVTRQKIADRFSDLADRISGATENFSHEEYDFINSGPIVPKMNTPVK